MLATAELDRSYERIFFFFSFFIFFFIFLIVPVINAILDTTLRIPVESYECDTTLALTNVYVRKNSRVVRVLSKSSSLRVPPHT